MKRIVTTAIIGLMLVGSAGCMSMPWSMAGTDKLEQEIGQPPSHFQTLSGRGTGVSDRAKEIEGRLGYR